MALGLFLMTNLRATTDLPLLWIWMFITGLGIGPTLSVFTIVVQNAVPFRYLGVSTSNLTFFRQIGGSIGLATLGTVFGTRLAAEIPKQLVAAGVPQQAVDQFGSGAGQGAKLQLVGDLGKSILDSVPAAARSFVEPLIPKIVFGIHDAYSIAISSIFQIGVVTTILALVVSFAMREIPLRTSRADSPKGAVPMPIAE